MSVVLSACYGQMNVANSGVSNWLCDRCIGGTFQDVSLCLWMLS